MRKNCVKDQESFWKSSPERAYEDGDLPDNEEEVEKENAIRKYEERKAKRNVRNTIK